MTIPAGALCSALPGLAVTTPPKTGHLQDPRLLDQTIHCIAASADGTRPIHVVRPDGLAGFLDTLPSSQAAFLRDVGFGGKSGRTPVLPGADGVDGAVLGIGIDPSPFVFGNLPLQLPDVCLAPAARRLRPAGCDPGLLSGCVSLRALSLLGPQSGVSVRP